MSTVTQCTYTRRLIDHENLSEADISIRDIARGLSLCCRFSGQMLQFYSVGQHSLLVSGLLEPEDQLAGLLHDASEAYLGDVSRNIKHSPYMAGYRQLEERMQTFIERIFLGAPLSAEQKARIKVADDLAAIIEDTILRKGEEFTIPHIIYAHDKGFVNSSLVAMIALANRLSDFTNYGSPEDIEQAFLRRFAALQYLHWTHAQQQAFDEIMDAELGVRAGG